MVTIDPNDSTIGKPVPTSAPAGPPQAYAGADPEADPKWWTLVAVCLGTFMLLLDVTIVNVALPDIQGSLKASFSDLQWVVGAYALTLVGAGLLLMRGLTVDSTWTHLVPGFAVAGVGVGLVNPPLASTAVGVVEP